MALSVITIPATPTVDMDLQMLFLIHISNKHIEILAEQLKTSKANELDPNDGREIIITISVNPTTGSIEFDRKFKFPPQIL